VCLDCGCETANKLANAKYVFQSKNKPQIIGELRRISLEHAVLAKNNEVASENRKWFENHKIKVINLISSPGSGKTLLLEKTVENLKNDLKMSILVGDQEKDFDAMRLKAKGAKVKQLNTLSSCHLDSAMISKELDTFVTPDLDLLIIENVGNLVCPAAFDLGESFKVALLSTPEGEEKPSKYPLLFHEAALIVITKIDLKPHLDWNQELCEEHIRKVNAKAPIIYLSSKTGEGMDHWVQFLKSNF
jgi:hydrogenase nickel incorporation protein HypB